MRIFFSHFELENKGLVLFRLFFFEAENMFDFSSLLLIDCLPSHQLAHSIC